MVQVAAQLSGKSAEKAVGCEVEPPEVIIEDAKPPKSKNETGNFPCWKKILIAGSLVAVTSGVVFGVLLITGTRSRTRVMDYWNWCTVVDDGWSEESIERGIVMKYVCDPYVECPWTNCTYLIYLGNSGSRWYGSWTAKLVVETVSDGQVWSWIGGDNIMLQPFNSSTVHYTLLGNNATRSDVISNITVDRDEVIEIGVTADQNYAVMHIVAPNCNGTVRHMKMNPGSPNETYVFTV